MRLLKYLSVFLLGFLIAKFWYDKTEKKHQQEELKGSLMNYQKSENLGNLFQIGWMSCVFLN